MRLHHYLAFVLVFATACQQGTKSEDQKKAVAPSGVTPAPDKPALHQPSEPLLDPATVVWKPHEVSALGIALNIISEVKVSEGTFNQGASYTRQDQRPLSLALWHGEGRTLDEWRRGLGPNPDLSEETTMQICDRKVRRQEVRIRARRYRYSPGTAALGAAGVTELGGTPVDAPPKPQAEYREEPARTIVAVAFEQKGIPVIVTYGIETAQREAWRRHEEQFFAALKCN